MHTPWSEDIKEAILLIGSGDPGSFKGTKDIEKVRLTIEAGLAEARQGHVPNSRRVVDNWDIEWFVVLNCNGRTLHGKLLSK